MYLFNNVFVFITLHICLLIDFVCLTINSKHVNYWPYLTFYRLSLDQHVGKICICICERKERIVLFNDTLNTFYKLLYGVRHNGK